MRESKGRENLPKSTVRRLILWLPQNATFSMDIHSNKKKQRERCGDVGGGDEFTRNRGGFSRFSLAQKEALSAVVAIISRRVIY